jgi:hypothetical protein
MISIPTLNELYLSIKGDLETSESVTIPLFGKSVIRAIAAVQAAKIKMLYLVLGNLQKNIFVDTADPEAVGGTLERFGRVKIGRDPFPPRAAEYVVDVTGEIGAVVPVNSTFKSNDNTKNPGVIFILDSEFTLTSTTDFMIIRALSAGLESQLDPLDELTATAPIPLVNSLVTVSSTSVEPLSAENIEDYRRVVVESFRLESQGGAPTDYRLWAADAQGVRRVYPYAKSGFTSEINLYVEATIDDSIDGKGTPSAGLLDDVEEVVNFNPDETLTINERGRRPITAIVNYLPVTVREIDIEIVGFQNNNAETTSAILSALTSAINNIRPFVPGADILADKNDILDKNKIIGIILSVRPGAVFTGVNLFVDSVDLSTFTFQSGDIPSLESVTYV